MQWEYKQAWGIELQELGLQGWEVYHCKGIRYCMKRPIKKIKTEFEIRDKIEKYGKEASKSYDHEYEITMTAIHMLRWVLNEENDATGDDIHNE